MLLDFCKQVWLLPSPALNYSYFPNASVNGKRDLWLSSILINGTLFFKKLFSSVRLLSSASMSTKKLKEKQNSQKYHFINSMKFWNVGTDGEKTGKGYR